MYSPKISEQHVPLLHKIARVRQVPMTAVVDEALSLYLSQINQDEVEKKYRQLEEGHHGKSRAA